MKKSFKVLSILLVLLLMFTACKKKPDPEPEQEVEAEVEIIEEEPAEIEEEPVEEVVRSPLSGLETTEELKEQAVVGIMLDNHPFARWQAGLREAELVYEIRVEGNFTRYLALYQVTDPEVIGPIRSARTPFVNRIMEYDAIYVHYGGSPQGISDISEFGVSSINGMAVGEPVYYRNGSVGKEAPHNAYSSMEEIRKYAEARGFKSEPAFEGFDFYEEATAPQGEEVMEFSIPIMPGNSTSYEYQEEEGFYHRYKDGELHIDENDGEALEVTNIILQYCDGIIVDNVGRVNLDDVGEGKGLLFTQGRVVEVNWKKEDRQAPTLFFDVDGEPIKLNIGQTFIQVVDEDVEIERQ